MATEDEKKARLLGLASTVVFGCAKGMYELFGESSWAAMDAIGENLVGQMEHALGLELHGQDPKDILTEVERLLVDEYGLLKSADLELDPAKGTVKMACRECAFWDLTVDLHNAGVPPYICVPQTVAITALRKRLKMRAKFVSNEQDFEHKTCNVQLRLG